MLMVSGPVYNLTTILENIGKGWRKETSHPTIHSVPKKSFSTTYLFWGWVLGSREPPEICLTALIYPNASLCLWKKLLDFFPPWKISIRKNHPILQTLRCPVFRNRTKGGFFLGIYGLLSLFSFLWTRSKWVRVVASAPKQCQRTGLADDKTIFPKVCRSYQQTPKRNWIHLPHCFDRKKFRKRLKSFDVDFEM